MSAVAHCRPYEDEEYGSSLVKSAGEACPPHLGVGTVMVSKSCLCVMDSTPWMTQGNTVYSILTCIQC